MLEQLPLHMQLGTDPWGDKGLTAMQRNLSSSPHCCSVFHSLFPEDALSSSRLQQRLPVH